MNILLHQSQFNYNYIYFKEKIKNTVYNNSNFIRIYYSQRYFTMNCISLLIPLKNLKITRNGNKHIGHINKILNNDIIIFIKNIETYLLNICNIKNKEQVLSLQNQLDNKFIKIYNIDDEHSNQISNLHLKISGIWETNTSYGITYKFLAVNKL